MKKKITLSIFTLTLALVTFFSCTKEVAKLQGPSDAQMFAWASDSTHGHYYYFQSDSTVNFSPAPAQGGFHGPFILRYNAKVKNALGSDGRLAAGNTLPDSSIIVKVQRTGNVINGYAVIFKLNGAWSWGWYTNTGAVLTSVTASPSLCLSCHNGTGNRDQTLVFTYH